MPFDANLVLADDTADWTYANLVSYGTPTSTVKNSGGFVTIDLLALSGTSAKGMAAILIVDEAGVATDDALTILLQASDSDTFASGYVQTLANFEVAGVTHGVILGNECPCTVVRRFATEKRYIRAQASATADDDFHTCWVLLAPWPFYVL